MSEQPTRMDPKPGPPPMPIPGLSEEEQVRFLLVSRFLPYNRDPEAIEHLVSIVLDVEDA